MRTMTRHVAEIERGELLSPRRLQSGLFGRRSLANLAALPIHGLEMSHKPG